MANSRTPFVIDPNTVIVVQDSESLTNEQLAVLLRGLPQQFTSINAANQPSASNALNGIAAISSTSEMSISNTVINSNSVDPGTTKITKTSGSNQPVVNLGSNQPVTPELTQPLTACYNNQPTTPKYSNQVSPQITLNMLTPESSPIVSNPSLTPKGARPKYSLNSAGSITSVTSRKVLTPVNTNIVECDEMPIPSDVQKSIESGMIVKDTKPFGTLVFFDLETTGLGHMIGKSNVQITEISMVAIDRKEFWQSKNSELKDVRIIHKLSMCVRPRTAVSEGAAKITGLDNFNLIDQYPFDRNAATTILSFLAHLPKPVCLLAHNGYAFDFPLLKSELKRLSMELPPDLLIADTLTAFKAVGIEEMPSDRKVCKSVKYGKNGRLSHSLENLHLFFFNRKPTGGHSSEGDCLALAKVCHKVKDNTLPWLEANARTLDTIRPML